MMVRGIPILITMRRIKRKNMHTITLFRDCVSKYPSRPMLINEADGKVWTYSDVESHSNRVANFIHSQGFRKGDCIAYFMENRPEYIAHW